jgi:hypothetical protein
MGFAARHRVDTEQWVQIYVRKDILIKHAKYYSLSLWRW